MKSSKHSASGSSQETKSSAASRAKINIFTHPNDSRSEASKERRRQPVLYKFQKAQDQERKKKAQSDNSSDCTYLPSIVQSSICEDQYIEDKDEEIKDMKTFVKENRETLRNFYGAPSEGRVTRSRTQQTRLENSMLAIKIGLAVIILIAFLIMVKFGNSLHPDTVAKAANEITNCWDRFKQENCDFSNPIGTYCKHLYDCTMRQRSGYGRKETQPPKPEQKPNQSLIQEFIVLFVLLVSFYVFGTNNILNFTLILIRYVKIFLSKGKSEDVQEETVVQIRNE